MTTEAKAIEQIRSEYVELQKSSMPLQDDVAATLMLVAAVRELTEVLAAKRMF